MNAPRSLLSSSVLMAGAAYLSYASGLLVSILAARTLGPQDYGSYAYVLWLSAVVVSLLNHGLPVTAIKFIAESVGRGDRRAAGAWHARLSRLHLVSLACVGLGVGAFLLFRPPAGWEGRSMVLVAVVLVAATARARYLFSVSVAKGHGIFVLEARSVSMLSALNVALLTLGWVLGVNLQVLLALYVFVSVLHWVFAMVGMRRFQLHPADDELASADQVRMREHLSWTIVLTAIGVFGEGAVNMYALNELVGAREVAYYSLASSLTKAGMDLLTVGLSSVLMSAMGQALGRGGRDELQHVFASSVRNFHFLGLLLAGLGLLASSWVVPLLYGPAYAPTIQIMQVMFLLGGLTLTEGVFAALLSVLDRQKNRVFINLICILFTIPVSWFLIREHGLLGAIWGYAINRCAVFMVSVGSVIFLSKMAPPWRDLRRQTALALAAWVLPACLVWLFPGLPVGVVACALFALGFVWIAARSNVWSVDERLRFVALAKRAPGLSAFFAYMLAAPMKGPA